MQGFRHSRIIFVVTKKIVAMMKQQTILKLAALWLLAVAVLTGCSGNDAVEDFSGTDAPLSKNSEAFRQTMLSGDFARLPLPVARHLLYIDGISCGFSTSLAVSKWEGEDIYLLQNVIWNHMGEVFDARGKRLAGTKYFEADWQPIIDTPLQTAWEDKYPGGYQIFQQYRQFSSTYEAEGKTWSHNVPLAELPTAVADRLRGYIETGVLQTVMLYQGRWRNGEVYYFDTGQTEQLPFDAVMRPDGTLMEWTSNADLLSFLQGSDSWQLRYVMFRRLGIGTQPGIEHQGAAQVQPVDTPQDLKVFFDSEMHGPYWDGQGNEHRSFFGRTEWNEDVLLVIRSAEEFRKAYAGTKQLPDIDFSRYTLILGKTWGNDSSYALREVRLYDNGSQYVLDIDILHRVWGIALAAIQEFYYWRLYPRLDDRPVVPNRIVTQNYDK